MRTSETLQRVSITMPAELVRYADMRAAELNTSRSQVIVMALTSVKASLEERLAAEGYRFYSAENAEFAETSAEAVAEAWASTLRPMDDEGSNGDGQTW
jgi:hypothetical protein